VNNCNVYRENGALSDIFMWNIYVPIVLCLNILWLKAVNVNEITARQSWLTRTSLRKHDVIKVCSIEYLTTQIELVLPTFKSWTIHKIFNVRTIVYSLWDIYHSTTADFFSDPPCTWHWLRTVGARPRPFCVEQSLKARREYYSGRQHIVGVDLLIKACPSSSRVR